MNERISLCKAILCIFVAYEVLKLPVALRWFCQEFDRDKYGSQYRVVRLSEQISSEEMHSYGSRSNAFDQFFALVSNHRLAVLLRFAQQSRAHLRIDVSKNGLLQSHPNACASSIDPSSLTHLAVLGVQHVLARRHHERAQLAMNMRNSLNGTSRLSPCSLLPRVLPKRPMDRRSRPGIRTPSIAPAKTPQRHRWAFT
jgi:hypothetical protein